MPKEDKVPEKIGRTEDEKLSRSPVKVILGGKEYEIKPLVIEKAREWRKKLAVLFNKFPALANVTSDDAKGFEAAMNTVIGSLPDEMVDLFFAYAVDLNRKEIEVIANEIEIAQAFEAIMEIALPLVHSLTVAMKRLAR